MANDFLKSVVDLAISPPARPSVGAPSPYEENDVDRRYEKFGITRFTDPMYYESESSVYGSDKDPKPYSGPLDVSAMMGSVADNFAGMPKELGMGLGLMGLSGFGIGAAASKYFLENIEAKMKAGEAGYKLAKFGNQIVGVGKGVFGEPQLFGTIPTNLTTQQRRDLIKNIMEFDPTKPVLSFEERQEQYQEIADEEGGGESLLSGGNINIVQDSAGRPVTSGDKPVTTSAGQYVDPALLQAQADAMQAAAQQDKAPTQSAPAPAPAPKPDPIDQNLYGDRGGGDRGGSDRGGSGQAGTGSGAGERYRATGGTVGFAEGGNTQKDPIQRTGFVEGPPQKYAKGTTVADTENLRVREGSFVINAPMTEKLQKAGVLPKGNQKRKAANGGKMMEVALSKGEYVVEPKDVPKFGGYNFLEAVNDMGKPEVERRQAMQEGGFVTPPERSPVRMAYVGEDISRPQIPLTNNMISAFKTYNASKQQRPDVNNLIDSLDDRENLALLALAETTAEKATMEAMMGVQQTSLNRIKSTGVKVKGNPIVRPDFTKATDLKSALKQRTPGRGSGSYMFQYDGLEPKFLTPKIKDVLKGAVTKDAITKIMASSENILDPETEMGGPLFPDDVTFYTREDAPLAKDMEMNPQLRYVTTIGGHDFYAYEASPESEDEVRLYEKYLEEKRKNSSATR